MQGIVTNVQRFCLHDGPGVRTSVFLKGCPLKCRWCHNPETQLPVPQPLLNSASCTGCRTCERVCPQGCHGANGERFDSTRCVRCLQCVENCPSGALEQSGKIHDAAELAEMIARDKPFFGKNGGATLTGGEPTFQKDFALALMDELKKRQINIAMETCGFFPETLLEPLLRRVDHFLWDVKDTDPQRHQENTGVPLEPILQNLRRAARMGADISVRGIILEGINAEEEHVERLACLAREIGAREVKLLRFHPYYGTKLSGVGRRMEDMGEEYVPSDAKMERLNQLAQRIFDGTTK